MKIGGTAVCMSSEYFSVSSCRDGKIATASFEKGNLIDYKEVDNVNKVHTGTLVTFKPDKEVFKNMTDGFSYERICDEIKNISYLNKGVKFFVTNEETDETKEYFSENGIADFIKDKVSNPLMRRPIIVSQTDGIDEIEVAFMWTKDSTQFYTFVNGLFCPENGSPITAAKRTFTTQIKKLSGKDFDPELIRKGLVLAVNCRVSEPSFANQTKSKVNNPSLGTLINAAIKQGLEEFSNTAEFSAIIEMLKKVQSAEKAADKAREAVLSQNKEVEKALKKKIVLAEKLADCRFHDDRSQLMICEGKSAKGALIKARNSDTTACFDLRGKLINTLKNDEEKVAKNEEITQLHIALGCGIGDKFNIKKLRYGKIVIMTDMDEYFVH